MRELLVSMSLGTMIVVVAVTSALVGAIVTVTTNTKARWVFALAAPLVVSYSLYWAPVWLGANPAEYSAWALLGVGAPCVAGLVCSVLAVVITTKVRTRHG